MTQALEVAAIERTGSELDSGPDLTIGPPTALSTLAFQQPTRAQPPRPIYLGRTEHTRISQSSGASSSEAALYLIDHSPR